MRESNIIRIKVPTALTSNTAFQIMLFLIWTRYTLVTYVLQIIKRLPYIGGISDFVFPIAIIVFALLALPRMQRHVCYGQLLFYLAAVTIVLFNMILYPENAPIIEEQLVRMIFYVLPMLFVGASYEHESDKKVLFWASLLGFSATLLYSIFRLLRGEDLSEYDMDAAYKILPSIMYLMFYAFSTKKFRYSLIAVIGFFAIFTYGTRGPILCVVVFLAVCAFMAVKNSKSVATKIGLTVMVAAALFYVLSGETMVKTAEVLSEQFSEWGFSTRIFDYFLEGDITEDSGRSSLTARVLEAIDERLLLGNGLLGDQVVLGNGQSGYYAHNLFLELWCQFGILFGTLLILYFIGWPIVAVYKQRSNKDLQLFLLMLICMNFTKLMLSSTYTVEMQFFFMLGVCMSAARAHGLCANRVLQA